MLSHPTATCLSLAGASSQPSWRSWQEKRGRVIGIVPDCALFAYTHWEPPSAYEHIERLAAQIPFPVYVVENVLNLGEDVKALTKHSGFRSYVDISVYLKRRGCLFRSVCRKCGLFIE